MEYKLEYITEKDFLKAKDDSLEQSRLIEEEGNAAYLVGWYWKTDEALVGPFESEQEAEDDAVETLELEYA